MAWWWCRIAPEPSSLLSLDHPPPPTGVAGSSPRRASIGLTKRPRCDSRPEKLAGHDDQLRWQADGRSEGPHSPSSRRSVCARRRSSCPYRGLDDARRPGSDPEPRRAHRAPATACVRVVGVAANRAPPVRRTVRISGRRCRQFHQLLPDSAGILASRTARPPIPRHVSPAGPPSASPVDLGRRRRPEPRRWRSNFEPAPCRSGRGLRAVRPQLAREAVVNRCGGGWSAVAETRPSSVLKLLDTESGTRTSHHDQRPERDATGGGGTGPWGAHWARIGSTRPRPAWREPMR